MWTKSRRSFPNEINQCLEICEKKIEFIHFISTEKASFTLYPGYGIISLLNLFLPILSYAALTLKTPLLGFGLYFINFLIA